MLDRLMASAAYNFDLYIIQLISGDSLGLQK